LASQNRYFSSTPSSSQICHCLGQFFIRYNAPTNIYTTHLQISIDAICVLADLAYTFLTPDCPAPESPEWLEVLAHISLAITTVFLIEIPLSLWSLGYQYMNPFGTAPHASLHAFDAIVIVTTFTLEVALRGREKELAGLLIILRLWRLVKLVGGMNITFVYIISSR
jgi:voltage-gated hydrogen channel 1